MSAEPQLFFVGVKAVVCVNGACLLLWRDKPNGKGHWDLPGGRMGEWELPQETLARELREELPALETYEIGPLVAAYPLQDRKIAGNRLLFLVYKVTAEQFPLELSAEHASAQWVRPGAAAAIDPLNAAAIEAALTT